MTTASGGPVPGGAPPIAHIVGRFPPPVDGQTLATELVAELLEGAREVRRFNTQKSTRDPLGRVDGVGAGRVAYFLRRRRALREALAAAPEAPVLWHSISPGRVGHWRDAIATLPAFAPGQPVAAVLHRSGFGDLFRSPLTAPTARRVVERVDRFVIQSRSLAAACAPHVPPEKVVLIPNTLDAAITPPPEAVERARAERLARRATHGPLRLLYLSQLLPTKGYREVLEAVALLRAGGVDVRADFVGGWNAEADRDAFDAFVRQHGLEGAVTAHGSIADRARAQAFFLSADVFLLPTYYPPETQPKAILEALAAGTPVVVTEHASIPEMVRGGREARFVAKRSPEAVAGAVRALADTDAWREASRDARERFESTFAPEAIAERWLGLLRTLEDLRRP